jgi:hypothetical protein
VAAAWVLRSAQELAPSLGSWVNYALGSANKSLPGYVLLHGNAVPPGGLENFSNDFLPATCQARKAFTSFEITYSCVADTVPEGGARQTLTSVVVSTRSMTSR